MPLYLQVLQNPLSEWHKAIKQIQHEKQHLKKRWKKSNVIGVMSWIKIVKNATKKSHRDVHHTEAAK